MGRVVKLNTPIPTLDEFGDAIGISKAERNRLRPIYIQKRAPGEFTLRRSTSGRTVRVLSSQKAAVEKARELSSGGPILLEKRHK